MICVMQCTDCITTDVSSASITSPEFWWTAAETMTYSGHRKELCNVTATVCMLLYDSLLDLDIERQTLAGFDQKVQACCKNVYVRHFKHHIARVLAQFAKKRGTACLSLQHSYTMRRKQTVSREISRISKT